MSAPAYLPACLAWLALGVLTVGSWIPALARGVRVPVFATTPASRRAGAAPGHGR